MDTHETDVRNTKFTIASSGYTFYDQLVSITSSDSYSSAKKPYKSSTSIHYFITIPGNSSSFATTSTIAATADTGNGWSQSKNVATAGTYEKITVTPATTYLSAASYTPAIGDVFYATSGALTHSYNASYGIPIGIVYNLNTTTKDKALGFKTGYVVALKRRFSQSDIATTDLTWATGYARTHQVTDMLLTEGSFSYLKADRDGLTHCRYAKNNYAAYGTECNVMLKAEDFVSMAPLPSSGTSGWHVPSTGQLHDWLLTFSKTCGGSGTDGLITDGSSWAVDNRFNYPTLYYNNYGLVVIGLIDRMNGWFTGKAIPSSYYDSWSNGQYYWASTEIKPDIAYTVDFHPTSNTNGTKITWQGTTAWKKDYTDRYLRCVLAF